jgi:hypothetical protein
MVGSLFELDCNLRVKSGDQTLCKDRPGSKIHEVKPVLIH